MHVPELAPGVRETRGLHDPVAAVELGEPGIAVGLEYAAELAQVRPRVLAFPVWRVAVEHRRRVGTSKRAIVADIDPEPRRPRASQTGLEHRHDGVVSMHPLARHDVPSQRVDERPQQACALAHHVGHRRAAEVDILTRVDFGLPVQREMIAVFGHQHVGQHVGQHARGGSAGSAPEPG
jgi:hypothetical protein